MRGLASAQIIDCVRCDPLGFNASFRAKQDVNRGICSIAVADYPLSQTVLTQAASIASEVCRTKRPSQHTVKFCRLQKGMLHAGEAFAHMAWIGANLAVFICNYQLSYFLA